MENLKDLHHWNVLAVSCIDGRFIKRINKWLGEQAGEVFDYRTEVGCSKAIIDSPEDRARLFNVIETSIRLHNVKEVWLIDHIDCGAYGGSKEQESEDSEKSFHISKLNEAGALVKENFPELAIKKIYANWDNIEAV